MTNEEFSNTFQTLLNSYNTEAMFGEQASRREIVLDEYEKSVLLTQAQDFIVKSYFDGRLNQQGQGFDDSERRQVDFSSLIKVYKPTPVFNVSPTDSTNNVEGEGEDLRGDIAFDERAIVYKLPENVLFILNEAIIYKNTKRLVVKPISYREYDREMSKAYSQPLKKQCWRIFQNQGTGYDIYSEIICNQNMHVSREPVVTYKQYLKVTGMENDVLLRKGKELPDDGGGSWSTQDLLTDIVQYSGIVVTKVDGYDGKRYNLESFGDDDYAFTKSDIPKYFYGVAGPNDINGVASTVTLVGAKNNLDVVADYNGYLDNLVANDKVSIYTTSEIDYEVRDIEYIIRYVKRPRPIVLLDLPDDLTIDGINKETTCELNPILHMDILNKAVELAIATRGGGTAVRQTNNQQSE